MASLRRVDISHRESFDGMIGFHNLDIGVGHSNKDGLMLWSLLDFGEDKIRFFPGKKVDSSSVWIED